MKDSAELFVNSKLSVIRLSVIRLIVLELYVVKLTVIVLSIIAPMFLFKFIVTREIEFEIFSIRELITLDS
jgi:hypothetical protein